MGNFKACLPHIIAFVLAGGVFTAGVELLTNDIREPKELVTDAPEDNTSPIDDNILHWRQTFDLTYGLTA